MDHNLLAGPTYCGNSESETQHNLDALYALEIGAIVSLIPLEDLIWSAEVRTRIEKEFLSRFFVQVFPLKDAGAPFRREMKELLNAVDDQLTRGRKVYLHCHAGRGRTGTVVGCWLARHGLAQGLQVLDRIAELRSQAGLSFASPETDAQRGLVVSWRHGE